MEKSCPETSVPKSYCIKRLWPVAASPSLCTGGGGGGGGGGGFCFVTAGGGGGGGDDDGGEGEDCDLPLRLYLHLPTWWQMAHFMSFEGSFCPKSLACTQSPRSFMPQRSQSPAITKPGAVTSSPRTNATRPRRKVNPMARF